MKDWKHSVERIIHLLPEDIRIKGEQMAEAYAYLYVLENSLRLFIETQLKKSNGDSYFDNAPSDIRKKYQSRLGEEVNHKWMAARGGSPLFYIDFDDLASMIVNNWDTFKNYFPQQDWIRVKLQELSKCRNLVAHGSVIAESEFNLIKLYFEQIIKHLQLTGFSNNNTSWDVTPEHECFIKGLQHSKVFSGEQAERGGEYILHFPAHLDVRPHSIRFHFYQVQVVYQAMFSSGPIWLDVHFEIGEDPEKQRWYPNSKLQFGLFDIDGDGLEEIFIGVLEPDHEMGIEINVLKYYPPALAEHEMRLENWKFLGKAQGLLIMEPRIAYVKDRSITIPRNFREQTYEKTWVKDRFRETGNFMEND